MLINWIKRPLSFFFILLTSVLICIALYKFKTNSAQGRLLVWKISLGIIKDHPILGIGFDSFKGSYNNYQAKYFASHGTAIEKEVAGDILYSFNEFMQSFVELGLIGVIIGLSILFIVLFKNDTQKNNFLRLGAKGSIIATLVISLFSYPFHIIPIEVNLIFFIAITSPNSFTVFTHHLSNKTFKVLSLVSIIAISFFSIRGYKTFNGYIMWEKAALYSNRNLSVKANILYNKCYPDLEYNEYFLYNYGCELSVMKNYRRSNEILEKLRYRLPSPELYLYLGNNYLANGDFSKAETSYKFTCNMVPNRFYSKYILAKFYQSRNRISDLLNIANEIVKMDVKVESSTILQIKWEMEETIKRYVAQNTDVN